MIKKSCIIRTGPIIMAILGFLTLASECRAFFYRPAAALGILSEYAAPSASAPSRTQVWKVVPETGRDGETTLRFFLESAAGAGAVCVLRLPPSGSAGEIVWTGLEKSVEKRSVTGLFLVRSFPAPCDVLPVGEKDGSKIYEEKVEAGGRVFSRSYRIAFDGFSVAEAKAMGWIRGEAPGVVLGLIMVAVTDEKGQPVVRQLWPAGGLWWLYEETPLRRSWLIE